MSKRRLLTAVGFAGIAVILAAGLPMTRLKADHCHSGHTNTAATPPTPVNKPAGPRVSNVRRHRTGTTVPNSNIKPVKVGGSIIDNAAQGSENLTFEEIYSKEFPMAIVSIGEAVKAIQSGDRRTELAELSKAVEKLMTVYDALGRNIKPQFANSLRCPIMGSAIGIDAVDNNLTREYGGRKVAFCCAGCPSAWDKLSDLQKQSKLSGAKF